MPPAAWEVVLASAKVVVVMVAVVSAPSMPMAGTCGTTAAGGAGRRGATGAASTPPPPPPTPPTWCTPPPSPVSTLAAVMALAASVSARAKVRLCAATLTFSVARSSSFSDGEIEFQEELCEIRFDVLSRGSSRRRAANGSVHVDFDSTAEPVVAKVCEGPVTSSFRRARAAL